ncbi:hypothetical protein M9Y10_042844 [Tritrichomonas musculus]|uniref:Ubiquitin-like domain-containing protein n=1 Tax=Tritrichomonas musculus TaxID=1915356 RepID=A0ABR2K0V5_9EUKA
MSYTIKYKLQKGVPLKIEIPETSTVKDLLNIVNKKHHLHLKTAYLTNFGSYLDNKDKLSNWSPNDKDAIFYFSNDDHINFADFELSLENKKTKIPPNFIFQNTSSISSSDTCKVNYKLKKGEIQIIEVPRNSTVGELINKINIKHQLKLKKAYNVNYGSYMDKDDVLSKWKPEEKDSLFYFTTKDEIVFSDFEEDI